MGSLMAGWDSYVDPKAAVYQRNRSFTKGEIEAYWRSKKKTEEDHLRGISPSPPTTPENSPRKAAEITFQRSHTFPVTGKVRVQMDSERLVEDQKKNNCWWTSSGSAFLNEPPVIPADETMTGNCRQGIKARMSLHKMDSHMPDNRAC
ncbi:uncharacterized protein LOC116264868 [Nymphaea colorata]|nr:uncharacterized protein LOC116264868 [Nymphaea colorata]